MADKYSTLLIQIDLVCGHLPLSADEQYMRNLNELRKNCNAALLGGVRFKYQPVQSGRSIEEDIKQGMENATKPLRKRKDAT